MASPHKCPKCAAPITTGAPMGLCSRCLLALAVWEQPLRSDLESANEQTASPDQAGTVIGPYKLIQQIGEGGFGMVWLAEQSEPVRRQVAMKLIKLGMDTKEVLARFEAERQALALMDHPNIARVFDAGVTESGRPYFIMELVRGLPLTAYCDEKNLGTQQRLQLMIQVCRAVQHAHQKGIIHRDIKPTNVLVTEHDGQPVPKVIDFGVAKALHTSLTDKTLLTGLHQWLGTPVYMSPEQAVLGGVDIDTRSDIYSLGVLLYELLTGRTPFSLADLKKAGVEGMMRIIREQDPPKPSTRLSTLAREDLQAVASHRQLDPQKLSRWLQGDLDWVVMKALEKDRVRRYETANAFAQDIERHLQNEPVIARPPSGLYRFRKMVRRNRVLFAGAGAVVAALVLGLGLSTWLYFKQKQAAHESNVAKRKSDQVAQFLKDMLAGAGPSVTQGRDATLLREILDKTSERVDKELNDEPEVQFSLRDTLANTYHDLKLYNQMEKVARANYQAAQSNHMAPGQIILALDRLADCLMHEENIREADALLQESRSLKQQMPPGSEETVIAMDRLGSINAHLGKTKEAEALYREAIDMEKKRTVPNIAQLTSMQYNLFNLLADQFRYAEAEVIARDTVALSKLRDKNTAPSDVNLPLTKLATLLFMEGKLPEAESTIRESLTVLTREAGKDHPHALDCYDLLVRTLRAEGKLSEAESASREQVALAKKLFGDAGSDVVASLETLSEILVEEHKALEVEPMWVNAIELGRKAGPDTPSLATMISDLAAIARKQGRLVEAERWMRECLAIREKCIPDDWKTFHARSLLGGDLMAQQKFAEAEPLLVSGWEGIKRHEKQIPLKFKPQIEDSLSRLVHLYEVTDRHSKAVELAHLSSQAASVDVETERALRQDLADSRTKMGPEHPQVAGLLEKLADLLHNEGRFAEAEKLRREELVIEQKAFGIDPSVSTTFNSISDEVRAQGRLAEAETLVRQCLDIREKTIPGSWRTFNARSILGGDLTAEKKFTEAEPFLLSGYEGMKKTENSIPGSLRYLLNNAGHRLVNFYETTGQAEKAGEWKKKLQ